MPPDEQTLAELLARLKKIKLDKKQAKKYSRPKQRPDKHKSRAAWNDHFERAISSNYDNYSYDVPRMEDRPEADWGWKHMDIANFFQSIAITTKEMMEVEGHLIAHALEDVVYGNFEADWAALDTKKKREIVLEGLYRGACAAPREDSRVSCPEMTVAGLAGDGKYSFLSLLKRLIAHDPTGNNRVKELFLFSHPYPDHQFRHSEGAPDLLKCFLYRATLYRNSYILETLWGILQAYHGRPPKKITIVKSNETCCSHGHEKSKAEKDFHAQQPKVDKARCKEQKANASYACYNCNQQTDDRDTLKRCAKCQTVWYCSKECQRADWKTHKKFCGQQRFDPRIFTPEVKEHEYFIGCPAVEPGFNRSPSLWRQIRWLSKEDSQWRDYHVMRNHLDPTCSTSLSIFCQRRD
ncbi:hypothetical protein C8R45DRAFT_181716 [Mycena sanguinolenta]|nr:hypothetical protein C8R45DRAFT_181716 [Mycena sanguinolenta]